MLVYQRVSLPYLAEGLNGYNHFHRIAKGRIQQTRHLSAGCVSCGNGSAASQKKRRVETVP